MFIRLLFIAAAIIAAVSPAVTANAREWSIVGPRALGMGGANVAVSNDANASYWNPAAFGFFSHSDGGEYGNRRVSTSVDAGAGLQVHEDMIEVFTRIADLNYSSLSNTGNAGNTLNASAVPTFIKLINELKTFSDNPNRAFTVQIHAAVPIQVSHYGIGAYTFADISARGEIDLVNILPSSLAGSPLLAFSDPTNFNAGALIPPPPLNANGWADGGYYFSAQQMASMRSQIASLPGWSACAVGGSADCVDNYIHSMDFGNYSSTQGVPNPAGIPVLDEASVVATAMLVSTVNTGGPISQNTTRLLFRGLIVAEVPITYGIKITEDLAVGMNLKLMTGRTINVGIKAFETQAQNALGSAIDKSKFSNAIGIDLAGLYRFGDDLRVGLTVRNVNSPKFEMTPLFANDKNYLAEKLQARAGIAYKPLYFITMAADYDLTKNETSISNTYKSQMFSLGIEFDLLRFIQLRVGSFQNLAQKDMGHTITAGLGLNLWVLNIDLGAAMAQKSTAIKSGGKETKIPHEVRVELAISSIW